MKVIREQLIEAAKTYTDFNQNITYQNITFNEKTNFFGLSFLLFFFETADLRSYCGYFLAICQLCLNLANISCCIVDIDILNILFYIVLQCFFFTFSFQENLSDLFTLQQTSE